MPPARMEMIEKLMAKLLKWLDTAMQLLGIAHFVEMVAVFVHGCHTRTPSPDSAWPPPHFESWRCLARRESALAHEVTLRCPLMYHDRA